MKFVQISNHDELRSWPTISRTFLIIVLGPKVISVFQISVLAQHVEDKGLFRSRAFKVDVLFGVEFACAVDRLFQTFLMLCMDSSSIALIDPSFCDISFLIFMVQRQRFAGMLPLHHMQSSLSLTEPSRRTTESVIRVTDERHVVNGTKCLE